MPASNGIWTAQFNVGSGLKFRDIVQKYKLYFNTSMEDLMHDL